MQVRQYVMDSCYHVGKFKKLIVKLLRFWIKMNKLTNILKKTLKLVDNGKMTCWQYSKNIIAILTYHKVYVYSWKIFPIGGVPAFPLPDANAIYFSSKCVNRYSGNHIISLDDIPLSLSESGMCMSTIS